MRLKRLFPRVPRHVFAGGFLLLALGVFGHFVQVTYGAGAPVPPAVQVASDSSPDAHRVRILDGLPVIRLSGTPYEMGRQHGALLGPQIRFLLAEYFDKLAVPVVGRAKLEKWAKEVEPHIPAEYREEMRGLADGAKLPYAQVLLVNTMVDRLQSVFCSTVVAAGSATVDGDVYFGRNLDFVGRNILHRATVVLIYEPQEGTRFVSVTWPGLIGVLSAMNEHGVAAATMMIHRGKGVRPGMPYMMMYRQALSAARKTTDVHDVIVKTKRTCPNNFMVVDKTGTAEVLEFDQDTVARRPAQEGCACSTNYFRTKELEDVGIPVGKMRYSTLENFLADRHGKIDLAGVQQALRDVAKPWFINVQAMIFMPARRDLYVAVSDKMPLAAGRYVHLDAKTIFGRVGKGVQAKQPVGSAK